MTVVTTAVALVLAGCAADQRVEENTTITLAQHDLQFVVPHRFQNADDDLVRTVVRKDLERSGLADRAEASATASATTGPATAAATGPGAKAPATRAARPGGAKSPTASHTASPTDPATIAPTVVASYETFLVDPGTLASSDPDTVGATRTPVPLTTGTQASFAAGLQTIKHVESVSVVNATTAAGPVLRASYQVVIGKDADGDVTVSYQTIVLGLDATSSLQITSSSLDEDVARDLADTIVASLDPVA